MIVLGATEATAVNLLVQIAESMSLTLGPDEGRGKVAC